MHARRCSTLTVPAALAAAVISGHMTCADIASGAPGGREAIVATGSIPDRMVHHGFLTDSLGVPLEGPIELTFAIYAPASGTPRWSETHADVALTEGTFAVELGSIVPLDATILDGTELRLEVVVGVEPLEPRVRLGTVPYAFRASITATVTGDGDADWQRMGSSVHRDAGRVGLGTAAPGADLHVVRAGDVVLRLDGDVPNADEGAQPSLRLSRSGGLLTGEIGFFDASNDLELRRTDAIRTTSIRFVDSGNDVVFDADVWVGGGVPGADATDGAAEILTVRGRSANWSIGVQNESSAGASDLFIGRETFEDGTFHIEHDGDVGIGTTSPAADLDVTGRAHARYYVSDTDLGPGATPVRGAVYRDNVVSAWAQVAADGALVASHGFVQENVSGTEPGEYRLRLVPSIAAENVSVIASLNHFSGGTLSAAGLDTIFVTTLNTGVDPAPAPFSVIAIARP